MSIGFDPRNRVFSLKTRHTAYQMIVDHYQTLLHVYYGPKIDDAADYLIQRIERSFAPCPGDADLLDSTFSLDVLPQEFPTRGTGDFRINGLQLVNHDGTMSCDLRYVSHQILPGKYSLSGLPAVYAPEDEAETLVIFLEDSRTKIRVELLYGVLPERDVITRAVKVVNGGVGTAILEKVSSTCLDFLYGSFDLIHFSGRHEGERNFKRVPIIVGTRSFGSRRGVSSHQHSPFFILAAPETTEDAGLCYGMSFVYSGGFLAEVEVDQFDSTRVLLGIQPEEFNYPLASGETFTAPEVILSCSDAGFTTLSHQFHRVILRNLIRGVHQFKRRPILINNWEATYFDFDGPKILNIARQAASLGIEMLVLDDGWFGDRSFDDRALGDWFPNEAKLGGTLKSLADQVNEMGLKFGIWMEPEMISEDSDLFRAHPDWALIIPGKAPIRGRRQLVLDFSRSEVVDYIFERIEAILSSANIVYLKWDMNRSITDAYSATAGKLNQGTVLYRYVLGLYRLLERIIARFPELLIEGCSGGGGRFDAGMMYYTPQIWCSDNTDALDRIFIQHGTSFGFPISTVGSHVSTSPNHQTGRVMSFETRGVVAMAGTFGYELDLNLVSDDEKEDVKRQVKMYDKVWELVRTGDYYRLTNPTQAGERLAAWLFVDESRSRGLLNVVQLVTRGNGPLNYLRLKGLDPDRNYRFENCVLSGRTLISAGVPVPRMKGDYPCWQVYFEVE